MHSFNSTADDYVLKPIAKGYDTVLPSPARRGVSNFFSNLDDITVIINDILQLKLVQALEDTGRFPLDSTLGIAGPIDVAAEVGLHKKK
ncbi:MAG TPA: ABC transporter, partial [Gammaproteobacteria bacterium]|nr:ABC transporter [Gammaproteobacteria bacterium]